MLRLKHGYFVGSSLSPTDNTAALVFRKNNHLFLSFFYLFISFFLLPVSFVLSFFLAFFLSFFLFFHFCLFSFLFTPELYPCFTQAVPKQYPSSTREVPKWYPCSTQVIPELQYSLGINLMFFYYRLRGGKVNSFISLRLRRAPPNIYS